LPEGCKLVFLLYLLNRTEEREEREERNKNHVSELFSIILVLTLAPAHTIMVRPEEGKVL